ncbi:uncharacterized protein METZ01_LOCUS415829 [marine metagenome]|uniref:Uncharacterized protein n=1 Tax=marine metagenome TaxID=408172 RepID=A0A382WXA6_9ZZZZ
MDGIKYQLAVISDQLAVHAGVLFFWTGLRDCRIYRFVTIVFMFILSLFCTQ